MLSRSTAAFIQQGLLLEEYFSEEAQEHDVNVSTSWLVPALHRGSMFSHSREFVAQRWELIFTLQQAGLS